MTSLFPHTPYAEDQPLSHSILYLHVVRAAAMTGSFIPLFTVPVSLLASRYRNNTLSIATNFLPRLLTHSARGIVGGTMFGIVATWGQMRGRAEIEWQDRSWRLLENKGEVDTDWWASGGAAVGAVAGITALRRGMMPVGVNIGKAVLGGAGAGMNVGIAYMVYTFATGRKPA
ncbi:hypothetical protein K504DRAFT_468661 [Pleomassaria siparia CBS 279.74]|uniref:Uncharacterized protein n=1 Tax=Pleomassaria siparia CBS 279.74 TaxID=1314801 RepID=A0A6G1K603_9PLEO|nr:hypothetical protein K504DRAFT_468661 [Pleomassaria siparia CBS 279.74]